MSSIRISNSAAFLVSSLTEDREHTLQPILIG